MVLGLLTIASIPTVIGTCEAVNAQKKQDAANKRSEKFNLAAACDVDHHRVREEVNDRFVVLRGGKDFKKVYLDSAPQGSDEKSGHPFCGYYFQYPGAGFEGLVSTISDDPPMLNWIFVDPETLELKYGNRTESLPNVAGPWDWTEDEQWLTLEGKEGFAVVEQEGEEGVNGSWQVYFDREGDWSGLPAEGKLLEVQLKRKLQSSMESKYVRE